MAKRRFVLSGEKRETLKREIKNYNRRVRRALKDGLSPSLAPSIQSIKNISIKTEAQYKKYLMDLQEATAETLRPNKKGTKLIYHKKKRVTYAANVDIPIKDDIPKYGVQLKDIDLTPTYGRFKSEREWIANKIGLVSGDIGNIDKLRQWLHKGNEVTAARWKENYLKAIRNAMAEMMSRGDYEAVDALNDLYDLISSMPLEAYLSGQLVDPAYLAIEYIYLKKGTSAPYYRRLIDRWNRFV